LSLSGSSFLNLTSFIRIKHSFSFCVNSSLRKAFFFFYFSLYLTLFLIKFFLNWLFSWHRCKQQDSL
jgi:hypothetical protein